MLLSAMPEREFGERSLSRDLNRERFDAGVASEKEQPPYNLTVRILLFCESVPPRGFQMTRELRATFQRKYEGQGYLVVVESIADGGHIADRFVARRMMRSRADALDEVEKVAGGAFCEWAEID